MHQQEESNVSALDLENKINEFIKNCEGLNQDELCLDEDKFLDAISKHSISNILVTDFISGEPIMDKSDLLELKALISFYVLFYKENPESVNLEELMDKVNYIYLESIISPTNKCFFLFFEWLFTDQVGDFVSNLISESFKTETEMADFKQSFLIIQDCLPYLFKKNVKIRNFPSGMEKLLFSEKNLERLILLIMKIYNSSFFAFIDKNENKTIKKKVFDELIKLTREKGNYSLINSLFNKINLLTENLNVTIEITGENQVLSFSFIPKIDAKAHITKSLNMESLQKKE